MRVLLPLVFATACAAPHGLDRGPIAGAQEKSLIAPGPQGAAHVEANWKERLEQPFVYLEHRGDYRTLGDAMQRLLSEARALDLPPGRAPFTLFYDDPGKVPLGELRAMVCYPVDERPGRLGDLRFDTLPRAMVVYARIQGAHPTVARAYPALFTYLEGLGWQQGGPVREVYLVDANASGEDMVTEVQIPWAARTQ